VILGYIHRMSHQKVRAEEKWGFYLITDERIEWLLDAVKQNKDHLMYGDEYLEILTRWSESDFSKVVEEHNWVWKIQGGTDEKEKATGILSEKKNENIFITRKINVSLSNAVKIQNERIAN